MAIITNANIPEIGIGGPSPAPDYCPPSIIYKDADEIYVPKGRYYKAGYRFNGQYQDLSNLSAYWDVADRFAVDIDATYSAGSTSGMLGGDVASSWYSVFMVDSDELLLLPFIRVDAISYSAPSTTINPAAHADGTTAENGFVTANDIFNTYRLVLLNDDATESGNVYTIADCTTGTPDTILITGDVTGAIAATEWLQMIPPDGTACLYLGCIYINSSGDLREFRKREWRYVHPGVIAINANLSTSYASTEMALGFPPTAMACSIGFQVSSGANNVASVEGDITYAGTDTDHYRAYRNDATSDTIRRIRGQLEVEITLVGKIRNRAVTWQGAGNIAADAGTMYVAGFKE
jgi:hypothetical protein